MRHWEESGGSSPAASAGVAENSCDIADSSGARGCHEPASCRSPRVTKASLRFCCSEMIRNGGCCEPAGSTRQWACERLSQMNLANLCAVAEVACPGARELPVCLLMLVRSEGMLNSQEKP